MITNDHYYRALNIMNRVEEVRTERKISRTTFGKQLGHTIAYYQAFYDSCRAIKVMSVIKFAKVLDVSVEYLLTGKKKEPYKEFNLNYDYIINSKVKGLPNSLKVIKSKLKLGHCSDMSTKTLYEFEKQLKVPAIKLIGG